MDVGYRNLAVGSGTNPILRFKEVLLEFGKLACSGHAAELTMKGEELCVPVLPRVDVQHERDQRSLEQRSGAPVKRESRACKLGSRTKVKNAQPFPMSQ